MIKAIRNIINHKKAKSISKYSGLSDFLVNASEKEKKAVFYKAAQLANEDQAKVYNSSLKIKNL